MDRSISINDSMRISAADTSLSGSFASLAPLDKRRVVNVAVNMTRNAKNYMNRTTEEMKGRNEYIDKHKIEWHRKLTLSFACIILFFIGAPLGAIIKKGGLGLPVIFSVIFFLIWHITSISGEKMVESGVLTAFSGMWLSSMVLLPISVFLTYKAAKDAALFDRDTYIKFGDRLKNLFTRGQAAST
jgi:lipopolysaccharide export system permease protein